jgi:4-diphosphocytidyl-2-C-methyl-D-erythritol kinase
LGCAGDVWTNDFEGPVFARYPQLAAIKEELLDVGAYRAALSGSGSTVFGQFQMVSEAIRAGSILESRFRVKLTKPLPRWEYFQKIVEET